MPYGWRQCEQSYNSVPVSKADCEKIFPDRFATNHSLVQSPNVPECFRSKHRTISSTLSHFGEKVGRLLILPVAPVGLANASHCDVRRSVEGSASERRISPPFLAESLSFRNRTRPRTRIFLRLEEGGVNLPLTGARKRLTQGTSFRDSGVT
jgi:hypothetical protein